MNRRRQCEVKSHLIFVVNGVLWKRCVWLWWCVPNPIFIGSRSLFAPNSSPSGLRLSWSHFCCCCYIAAGCLWNFFNHGCDSIPSAAKGSIQSEASPHTHTHTHMLDQFNQMFHLCIFLRPHVVLPVLFVFFFCLFLSCAVSWRILHLLSDKRRERSLAMTHKCRRLSTELLSTYQRGSHRCSCVE